MIDLLPPHLKTMVKSSLRDARHLARKIGNAAKNNGDLIDKRLPSGSGHLIGKIADYSDSTLVALETIALDILSNGKRSSTQAAPPHPLSRYFASGSVDGRRFFPQDAYVAIKQIMRVKGVSAFRVSEASLETSYIFAKDKIPPLVQGQLSTPGYSPLETIALAAACMAQGVSQSLVVYEPLQFRDEARDVVQEVGPFLAAAIAMSCAAVTYHHDLDESEDVFSAACSAIDSRYALIRPQLVPGVAPDQLAKIFAGLLPHIP